MPLVSVVVPTHNRPEMLAEALASVRAQTFTGYEIIVVSNGESPEMRRRSQAIATLYDAWWFALDEGNLSAARNFGIDQAKGGWIAFLDDDDLWLPEKLARQLAEAEHTGADMVSCDYVEFDAYGVKPDRILRPGPTDAKKISHQQWWTAPSATLIRAEVLRDLKFDTAFTNCEDTDLWRRISWRHRLHHMDAVLLKQRRAHPSVTRNRFRALWSEVRLFKKMRQDTPPDLRWALPPMKAMKERILQSVLRIYLEDMWTSIPLLPVAYRQLLRLRLRTRLRALAGIIAPRIR